MAPSVVSSPRVAQSRFSRLLEPRGEVFRVEELVRCGQEGVLQRSLNEVQWMFAEATYEERGLPLGTHAIICTHNGYPFDSVTWFVIKKVADGMFERYTAHVREDTRAPEEMVWLW